MSVSIIIGKNFGDEGKGLATDYFAARALQAGKSCLVIRHNGGAQAGHTVDLPPNRFVFHQLSSGSFRNADTYWDRMFLPDLYKLQEEAEEFALLHGSLPRIFGHPMCRCVYIDDVLVNMALETARGDDRHGSCGMGINEAVERSRDSACGLLLVEVCAMTSSELYQKLVQLRRNYLPRRLQQLGLSPERMGEYGELLADDNVLRNAAEEMWRAARLVTVAEETVVREYDDILFEGAQGLLLDENYLEYAPHLTSSRTGCHNPSEFVSRYLPDAAAEIVYVTRSYVTRHGAGPLPGEADWNSRKIPVTDHTNLPNDWQGSLRSAPHGTRRDFFAPLLMDLTEAAVPFTLSCMVTHLNCTGGTVCSISGDIPVEDWFSGEHVPEALRRIYCSNTPYAEDITCLRVGHGRIFP